MSKVIIQCNTFLKPEVFDKMKEEIASDYMVKGVLVLPAYCELKAVLEAEQIEVVEKG